MRRELLDVLVDPVARTPLELDADGAAEEVEEGVLHGAAGRVYPVRNGIPRLVLTEDAAQRQTEESFGYKWSRRDSWEGAPRWLESLRAWLVERYDFGTLEAARAFFAAKRWVLDAGCGGGFSTSAWMPPDWGEGSAEWVGADISDAIDVARDRLRDIGRTHFVQADVLELPFREETFDAILSEGVLHHTPSTRDAFLSLVPLLAPGGELLFYVYRRKSPVREFTDDHVRGLIAGLDPEEAWEALRPLTRLGRSLAELGVEVEVEEDVPQLGIKAGRYDLQRLLYWHFAKLFWNPELTFEQNHHVNFDWYHPRYAHRHTEEEVRSWCAEAGLEILTFVAQESGFTVRARRG